MNVLRRKQSCYTIDDCSHVERVLRYLKAILCNCILFKGEGTCIDCYPDTSLRLNDEKGQPTVRFIIRLFGDPMDWRTKKQNHEVSSSAPAEFVTLSLACPECVVYVK